MSPPEPSELRRFLDAYLYEEAAFLVDEMTEMDASAGLVRGVMHTTRPLPTSVLQRVGPHHPAHVSASDMLMLTGNLGCLHAWFLHGCRFDEGWTGFGNRIHRADFKRLARIGPPLELESRELRARDGAQRVVIRFEFHFRQEGELVYYGDQTAMFIKEPALA
ncbi:MAG: hypothetical protein ACR2P8_02945 [Myxococcota bacterium]